MLKQIVYTGILLLTSFLQATLCLGQEDQTVPSLRLLVYGRRVSDERQNAEQVVAEKWGIEFFPVAACVVAKELADSAQERNEQVESLIHHQYGKDWRKRFEREVDAELETQMKVLALLDKIDAIKKQQEDSDREGSELQYILRPVSNTTAYRVVIVGLAKEKGDYKWITHRTLLVDYQSGAVQLLANQPVKE